MLEVRVKIKTQELIEQIEGMKKKTGDQSAVCDNESCTAVNAYNEALDDVIFDLKIMEIRK